MSDIRFNQWLHNSGTGGVSQVDGGHVGIGTTNPLIPVGSGVTAVLNVGVVTANYYYGDGSNLSGVQVGGASSISFNDNIGAYFGNSQDLKIHHDGNHSYIDDQGTGNLRLRSGTLEILNLAGNKTSAIFSSGGGQTLNFNNNTKFVTTNTGVLITGITTSTSRLSVGNNTTNAVDLEFGTNRGSAGDTLANINWKWNNTYVAQIRGIAGSDTTNKDDGHLAFFTSAANNLVERLRIDANGDINLGNNPTNQYGYKLNIQDTAILYAQTASSGGTELKLNLDHGNTIATFGTVSTSHLAFVTTNAERLRITTEGAIAQTATLTGNTALAFLRNARTRASGNKYGIEFRDSVHEANANIVIQQNSSGNNAAQMSFYVNGGTGGNGLENGNHALKLKQNGDVEIPDGNLILASGHGINFSATSDASGMSNEILDDYEEGSWTPALSNQGTMSYSHQIGRYTKVGRQVHFIAYVRWNSRSNNGSYNITYSGLPFTSINISNFNTPIYVGGNEGFSCNNSSRTHIGGNVYVNNTQGQFRVSSAAGDSEISLHGAYGSTGAGYIYWGGSYYTS